MHAIPETADTDLHPWVPVLEKFHEFLDTPETNAALIKAVLDFIGQLLHYGRNKACCYFIDVSLCLIRLSMPLLYTICSRLDVICRLPTLRSLKLQPLHSLLTALLAHWHARMQKQNRRTLWRLRRR